MIKLTLNECLAKEGITRYELAKRTECNKTTLGRWLRGETNLSKRLEKDLNEVINNYLTELEQIKE